VGDSDSDAGKENADFSNLIADLRKELMVLIKDI